MSEQQLEALDGVFAPDRTDARPWLRDATAEVWEHLPAWMYLGYGVLLLNTLLTNLVPARPELAFTAAFPISVFVGYQALRAWREPRSEVRRKILVRALVPALGLPVLNLLVHRPSPLAPETLRLAYEISNFGWVALMVTHAWQRRRSDLALLFGAGLVYGALLENGGILLGFFDEVLLRGRVWPFVAPVSTMLGWSVVLYLAFFVTRAVRGWLPAIGRSPALSGAVVALVAVLLDLEIDPVATASGCWVWHTDLPPALGDVPLVNFIAWACALWPFGWVVFRLQARRGLTDAQEWKAPDVAAAFAAVPAILVLAATCFLAVTWVVEGAEGPSWTVLYRTFQPVGAWLFGA